MTFRILLVVACTTVFPVCANQVDDFIRGEMAKQRIPAVVLKIVQDGREVKTAAYGFANLELGVLATTNSVFEHWCHE